jgi:hypothetical protein
MNEKKFYPILCIGLLEITQTCSQFIPLPESKAAMLPEASACNRAPRATAELSVGLALDWLGLPATGRISITKQRTPMCPSAYKGHRKSRPVPAYLSCLESGLDGKNTFPAH